MAAIHQTAEACYDEILAPFCSFGMNVGVMPDRADVVKGGTKIA